MTKQTEERPLAEPDCFSFFPEGDGAWITSAQRQSVDLWHGKCEEGRWTIVNAEHPDPRYCHGLYFEGWSVAPCRMDPPHKAAPFNYPLVAEVDGKFYRVLP